MSNLSLLVAALAVNAVSQDPATRAVTVDYTLSGSEPAIVILTGATSGSRTLPDKDLYVVSGDANRVLQSGAHTLTWQPPADCALEAGTLSVTLRAWATNAPPDYMVFDLAQRDRPVRYYASEAALPGGCATDRRYTGDYLLMRRIPAAQVVWRMGSPTTESGRWAYQTSGHETSRLVKLTEDYYLGVFPVTVRQYKYLLNADSTVTFNASSAWGNINLKNLGVIKDSFPVGGLAYVGLRSRGHNTSCTATNLWTTIPKSWPHNGHEIETGDVTCPSCGKLAKTLFATIRERLPGWQFDLPTSAQWEFACRGGSTVYESFPGESKGYSIGDIAWYLGNSSNATDQAIKDAQGVTYTETALIHPVGQKLPNGYGLYDMIGNINEWCLDWATNALPNTAEIQVDPVGSTYGNNRVDDGTYSHLRVIRGGCWYSDAPNYARTAACGYANPYYGQMQILGNGQNAKPYATYSHGFRLWLPCHAVK